MIVVDGSVLIAYLDGQDSHHRRAQTLLAGEIDDGSGVDSSTSAGVLVVPARHDRLGAVCQALRDLELQELPFSVDTAVKLADRRAHIKLKMPDCFVPLAAEDAGARLATVD